MFCSKNKIIFLIFIISIAILFCGCKENNDYSDEVKIVPENIFDQDEEKYYVFFYKDSCPYCEDVFEYVLDYIENKDNDIKLYVCDLSDKKLITYSLNFKNSIYEITVSDNKIVKADEAINCVYNDNYYIIEYPNSIQLKVLWKNNKIVFNSDGLQTYSIIKEEVINCEIKRAYDGNDGQGSSGKYYVNGVRKYNDLYIAGVPSLILINEEKVSTFITSGRKNIKEFFNNN